MRKKELPGFSLFVGVVVVADAVPGVKVLGLAVVAVWLAMVVLVVAVVCLVVVVARKYRICTSQKSLEFIKILEKIERCKTKYYTILMEKGITRVLNGCWCCCGCCGGCCSTRC